MGESNRSGGTATETGGEPWLAPLQRHSDVWKPALKPVTLTLVVVTLAISRDVREV